MEALGSLSPLNEPDTVKKRELMFDRAYVNERWDRYDSGRCWLMLVRHVLRLVKA